MGVNPTREETTALLELESKATPGDWTYEENGGCGSWISGTNGEWAALSCGNTNERADENAALIAAARNLIRPLAEAYRDMLDARETAAPGNAAFCRVISAPLSLV